VITFARVMSCDEDPEQPARRSARPTVDLSSSSAGTIAEPPALIPSASKAQAIVLGELTAAGAGAGAGDALGSFSSSSLISPALWRRSPRRRRGW